MFELPTFERLPQNIIVGGLVGIACGLYAKADESMMGLVFAVHQLADAILFRLFKPLARGGATAQLAIHTITRLSLDVTAIVAMRALKLIGQTGTLYFGLASSAYVIYRLSVIGAWLDA